jgi:septum formation protein
MKRLAIGFRAVSADVDERPEPGESATDLAVRLAGAKARAISTRFPDAIVIGSDQVAAVGDRMVGKPGSRGAAKQQLELASGQDMNFYTAVCVVQSGQGKCLEYLDTTRVVFRELDHRLISNYLDKEQALDCAGSFKSEGLGISLVSRIDTQDPTALIGLPMIWLSNALQSLGVIIL